MANAILQDIQRIVLNRVANNIVEAGFNAAFGGGGGGSGAASIGGSSMTLSQQQAAYSAAIAGGVQTPGIRSATMSSVAGVVKDQSAPLAGIGMGGNVVINVQNNSSQPLNAKSGGVSVDSKQTIIGVIVEDYDNGGVMRGLMQGRR